MDNYLKPEEFAVLSPTARRVVEKLSAGLPHGHASKIWDMAVRSWRTQGTTVNAVFQEALDDLIACDEAWIPFGEDAVSLLASYDVFTADPKNASNQVVLRLLIRSAEPTWVLVKNIAAVEAVKRALEATETTQGYQRANLNTQGPMGGSGGGWTC